MIVAVCPECRYSEVLISAGGQAGFLSDDWCGHNRDAFIVQRAVGFGSTVTYSDYIAGELPPADDVPSRSPREED